MKQQNGRVLMVNAYSAYGGIGKYILNILSSMNEGRVDMLFLCYRDNQMFDGYKGKLELVNPFFSALLREGSIAREAANYLYFPNVIPKGYPLYHISSHDLGKCCDRVSPSVITCHDVAHRTVRRNYSKTVTRIREKHIESMRYADAIISISEATKRDLVDIYNFPEDRIHVIYHGVDGKLFRPGSKEEAREKLDLPQDRKIVLNIGTEHLRKNIPLLLHAVNYLRDTFPDMLLLRVGNYRDKNNQKLIEQLGLQDTVKYFNCVRENEIPLFYQAADLSIFPSYYEGFGMPVLEALSSGCPVLASNTTSIPEITGDSAVLFNPHDAEDLLTKTKKILSNPDMLRDLGEKGNERAKEFTWERTAQFTEELYDSLIEEHYRV